MRVRGDQYQGELKVGQKVYSGLYGGRYGIIAKINGTQDPCSIKHLGRGCIVMGGHANIDVVFDEYLSRAIPESIIRGVQWEIMDEYATPDEILSALTEADMHTREKKTQEEQAKNEREKRRESLPSKYPYLQKSNPADKISGYALGAKNIRTELKRAFPSVKFTVRSEGYSGGCSINIGWTDGPSIPSVEKITKKYQEGNFNGMEDIYENDRENVWPDVFGGAKYVFNQRSHSKDFVERVAKKLGYSLKWDEYQRYECIEENYQNVESSRHWLNKELNEKDA
jgi:hypothetical protein